MQGAKSRASTLHWNVAVASTFENVKTAETSLTDPDGPELIVGGSGGAASTLQDRDTAELRSPEASFARTWNVCDPLLSDVYVLGVVQSVNVAQIEAALEPHCRFRRART